jgi:hypothetical protein
MARGLSLHIGVNVCDPDHYGGWSGPLECCEADADAIHTLARDAGFEPTVLKTALATRAAVTNAIASAAATCEPGDFFLVSYAGHGGQIADVDGDESDQIDETWCLYDGQLLDDELNVLWARFGEGVRILVLSDSCHSGSVTKSVSSRRGAMGARNTLFSGAATRSPGKFRFMPRSAAAATQRKNREFYAGLQTSLPSPRPPITASVRLLSGCQDNQLSSELDGNGVFTRNLLQVWDNGNFTGDYRALHRAIIANMHESQQPNHLVIGGENPAFDAQRPFSI